jgi:uncharacterized protein
MQLRTAGKTGEKLSVLGMGTMRLPTIDGDYGKIDEEAATKMLRYAVDNGVNYIDTAYPYHNGTSEPFCGRALQDGYREKVMLASKLPPWEISSIDDCERILDEQLEKCQTDHFDFYLVHCILKTYWPLIERLKLNDWLRKIQEDGRVRHVGFSFHDDIELFKTVLDYYDWSFCQIQYNFLNENHQAGTAGLKMAAEKGLGVIAMEPLLGGAISDPPPTVQEMWDGSPYEPVDTALRWILDHPEVSMLLTGASNFEQLEQNIAITKDVQPGAMPAEEHAFVAQVVEKTAELNPIPCTRCNYCMPCPNGVNIPTNFAAYNLNAAFSGNGAHKTLHGMQEPEQQSGNCSACGECEPKCPQGIPIIEWLAKIAKEFA